MCYFAFCLGAFIAKPLPGTCKDVAPRVTGSQGQAGGLQPLFRGAPASGWHTVWWCASSRGNGLEAVWGHCSNLQGAHGLVTQSTEINHPKLSS